MLMTEMFETEKRLPEEVVGGLIGQAIAQITESADGEWVAITAECGDKLLIPRNPAFRYLSVKETESTAI